MKLEGTIDYARYDEQKTSQSVHYFSISQISHSRSHRLENDENRKEGRKTKRTFCEISNQNSIQIENLIIIS